MQKLLTIAIDTNQLNAAVAGPFDVTEVTEINEHLELGWQIEEWDFLKEGETDGQVVLLIILNDDLIYEDNEDEFDTSFQSTDEYEEDEEGTKLNKI